MKNQENNTRIDNNASNYGAQGVFNAPVNNNTTVRKTPGFWGNNAAILSIIASIIAILAFFGISSYGSLSRYFLDKNIDKTNAIVDGTWFNKGWNSHVKMVDGVIYDENGVRIGNYVVLDSSHIRLTFSTIGVSKTDVCSMKVDANHLNIYCDRMSPLEFTR